MLLCLGARLGIVLEAFEGVMRGRLFGMRAMTRLKEELLLRMCCVGHIYRCEII